MQNRNLSEVFCYSLTKSDNTLFFSQIEKECYKMEQVHHLNALQLANLIRKDKIDILINMNGYTKGALTEVFALKPAPIQVMWLGYPGGSGSEYMDYLITDKITTPLNLEAHYSEKFAYLNRSFFIGDHAQMFKHLNNRIIISCYTSADNQSEQTTIRTILHTNSRQFKAIEKEIGLDQKIANMLAEVLEKICLTNNMIVRVNLCGGMDILNGMHILQLDPKSSSGERCPMKHSGQQVVGNFNYTGIVTSRLQYGMPLDKVVYCNFNQLYKIDPGCLDLWARILKSVPNSVIWLLRFPITGEANIKKEFAKRDVNLEQVIFTNVACKEEHWVGFGICAGKCGDGLRNFPGN